MAPRRPAASKGLAQWQASKGKHREVPSGHREVFISGVPFGMVHLVGMDGSVTRDRTVCGGWPGRTPAPKADQKVCPVCFPRG